MSDSNLDHEDFLEASGKYADQDWDTEQERREYERYLDDLYAKEQKGRKRGL